MNHTVKDFNKKTNNRETLTPHRLTVAILIQEFFKLRDNDTNQEFTKKHIRDFCVFILKLIHSPDLTLTELQSTLTSKKFQIHEQLIANFNETLSHLNSEGVGYLLNLMGHIGKLILRDSDTVINKLLAQINKNSVIGYYLRRLLISFDKLTFSEVASLLKMYQRYYTSSTNAASSSKLESFKNEDWFNNKEQWSKRQAELFIASQAALLCGNEEKAFTPDELHKHIQNLLKSNPDLAEAHFLSYLNYLRVKEFCGAINSLYHCFDKNHCTDARGNLDDKSRGYRFAALNLAVLHFQFGHGDEALAALKEAIMLAQEANDNACLQHALSWLYCFKYSNKDKLLEHSILKSLDLNLNHIVSLGIQSFVQYAGVSGGTPKYIFKMITQSDIVNCQHVYSDLTCSSYAQKSAMWLFYGKTEMSSLWSQLLLYLNSDNNSFGKMYFGEALCQAICNQANHLLMQGEYKKAYSVLTLARDRFPNEPISHIWMLCENIFTFVRALHHEEWVEAETAAQQIAVYDVWESHLRMAELCLQKRDFSAAHKCVSEVLDSCNSPVTKLRIDYHVRALVLLSEIQYTSGFPNVIPPSALNVCVAYTSDFHVDYLGALVYLHLANVQLLMGIPGQALKLLDRCLAHILSHGGNYDRARAILLYVKCLVTNVAHKSEGERKKVVTEGAKMLDKVYANFSKVEAYGRMKEVLYLQARLYNEANLINERNKCALNYRTLEEDHPSKNNVSLVTFI